MNAHTREPFHIRILKGLLGIIWSIDWPLMVIVLILSAWGFVALYSAGYSFPWRIDGQIRNLAADGGGDDAFCDDAAQMDKKSGRAGICRRIGAFSCHAAFRCEYEGRDPVA